MVQNNSRIPEIDLLRGLAVIGMIVFHFFFILDFFEISSNEMYTGGWLILARFVQFTFITLVGISMSLSHRRSRRNFTRTQFKRGLIIFSLGMLVTISTYLTVPKEYVKFGILHFIGLSIILTNFLAGKKHLNLILAALIVTASPFADSFITNYKIFYFLTDINLSTSPSLDYYPLFPWMSLIFLGMWLANTIYGEPKSLLPQSPGTKNPAFKIPAFFGRHSLVIYMLHVPIILSILLILQILPLKALNL